MAKIGSIWKALYWGDNTTVTRTSQADGTYSEGVSVETSSTGAEVLTSAAAGTERGLAVRVVSAPSASGGTSSTDGAAYTAAASAGTPVMGARDDAGSATVAEDKLGIARITTNRALHVNLRDASGNEVSVGGGTQYTEDAAAVADPLGTVPILVRKDTPAATVSADGDNIAQRGTNYGAAYVTLLDTSGTAVSVGGGTQYAEDTASTAADLVTMAGVVRKDAAATLVDTDGDRTQLQVTAAGKLWTSATIDTAIPAGTNAIGKLAANDGVDIGDVTVNNAAGASAVNVQDGGNSITVDNGGTFAVQSTIAAGATNIAKAEDVAAADADVGVPSMAVRKAAPANTSGTDGDYEMLQMSAGRLWVDPSGVTLTVGSHAVTNAGTFAVQDSEKIADDAAFTVGTTKVMPQGYLADETSTDSVDEGDIGAARMTLDRKVIVTVEPHTAGGWDTFMATSADGSTALTATAQAVKASAGKLGGWYIYNPNATVAYVIIYNVAQASVTVGTTNPKLAIPVPATSAANIELTNGITFDTAIAVAATTTGGGNTAPGTALECNLWYK